MSRILCSLTGLISGSLLGGLLLSYSANAQESATDWIRELSHERFSVRSAAEKKLWAMGDAAVPELQKAVAGQEPETSLRAAKILRYLHWGLTPETPEEIIKLTERFPQLTEDQKNSAYASLIKMREYRLALLLYNSEKDPQIKARTRESVRGLAILSARASILAGKTADARKTLEEFRDDPQNLVALAWLARAEGNLEKEIAATSKQQDRASINYHLALLRAQGNRQAIAEFAEKHDYNTLHATMELLEGRPQAWINYYVEATRVEHEDVVKAYHSIVLDRWNNPDANVSELLNMLTKAALKGNDNSRRWTAINALNALGETKTVEKAVNLINPSEMFSLYVDTEKIDDALRVLDLDPQNPDYHSWLGKVMDEIIDGEIDDGMSSIPTMLGFLERRGIMKPIEEVFVPKMLELAKEDLDSFQALLDSCFSPTMRISQAPESAVLVAEAYCQDDAVLWGGIVESAFGLRDSPNPSYQKWFDLLAELYPEEKRLEVLRKTLQLFRRLPINEKDLAEMDLLIEKHFQNEKKDDKEANRRLMILLAMQTQVGRYSEWLAGEGGNLDARELMAQERWKEAADQWNELAKMRPDDIENVIWAAACYRKADMLDEAKKLERLMDFLIMGDVGTMYNIALTYESTGFRELASMWKQHQLNCSRADNSLLGTLFLLADKFLLDGNYQQARAYYDAYMLAVVCGQANGTLTIIHRYRNKSRIAEGFSMLAKDRTRALAILQECHQGFSADASLADEFFPLLRKNRLMQQHDEWFEKSWQAMMDLAKRFPKDDNIRNSAAWLASRCIRRLDDAEEQSKIALELRPMQAAYLDTMAEIWFARGNRAKAVEWSRKAIVSDPTQEPLKEQYFRFQSEKFPQ